MAIEPGIKGHDEVLVTEQNVAAALGSGALPVFSTPTLIICMERACLESVQPYLEEGESTVGTRLEVDHIAATPIGMTVETFSNLIEVDRRRLVFEVRSYAGGELVGKGLHTRFVVNSEKFMLKAAAKKE